MLKELIKWLLSVLSEDGGTGSCSRVSMLCIVASGCFCLCFLSVKNHALPDLNGLTAFVTMTTGALYGINQLGNRGAAPKDGQQ